MPSISMHAATVVSTTLMINHVAQAVIHPQLVNMEAIQHSLSSDSPSMFALRCLLSLSNQLL